LDIILDTPGTRLNKRNELLSISIPEREKIEVPLRNIETIIADSGVQITTQVLKALSSSGVNIVFTSQGRPFGLYTPFGGVATVHTRRQQLLAYEDWRGAYLATQFVYAAIENKRRLLLYFAKNRKRSNLRDYTRLRAAAKEIGRLREKLLKFSVHTIRTKKVRDIRMELMGVEGRASATYFMVYGSLFPDDFKVYYRTRRPPRDPVNSLLSLGYTVLLSHVIAGILSSGLELYGGYLHSDRSGKPSLALDLIEEFRQPIIDRMVARIIQKQQLSVDDFEESSRGFRLKDKKKQFFYEELRKEITGSSAGQLFFPDDAKQKPPEKKKGAVRLNYKKIISRQARKIVNFLIGAKERYKPFVMNY